MSARTSHSGVRGVVLISVALALLAVGLGLWSHHDAQGRAAQAEGMMIAQARALSTVIAASSVHEIAAFNAQQRELARLRGKLAHLGAEPGPTAPGPGAGPGHLIRALGGSEGLRYVVIQNEYGILAASQGVAGFPAPGDDPHLRPLSEGADFVSREYDDADGHVYEVARVVDLGGPGDVLLRIGLDGDRLASVRRDIRHRSIWRGVVLLFSVILATSLLTIWQRQGTLRREVARVRAELEAREAEARRAEKLVAMGALAAGVAHQVRNPLNTVHMIAQRVARRPGADAEIRSQAALIVDESARIEGIVQNFLDFATPRRPEPVDLDLDVSVRAAVERAASVADADGDAIVAEIAPVRARLDPAFVAEILENLLRNAREAAGPGGAVRVALRAESGDAVIEISDDGPGVPEAERDRIFDLYYTTRPEGTSLGLSLVAQMVAALDGALSVTDARPPLGGARFVIRFPLRGGRR